MMIMLQNMVELQFMDSAVTGRARGKKLGRGDKKKKGQPDWNLHVYIFIGGRREQGRREFRVFFSRT